MCMFQFLNRLLMRPKTFAWTTEEFVRVQYVHKVSHSPATFLLPPATQHLPASLLVFSLCASLAPASAHASWRVRGVEL